MQWLSCVCELPNSSTTLKISQKDERMSQLIAHELGNLGFPSVTRIFFIATSSLIVKCNGSSTDLLYANSAHSRDRFYLSCFQANLLKAYLFELKY